MSYTPVLDKLSKDLAAKIFDPVSSGRDDGRIFSKAHRLGYLNRAYGKLIRTLEVIHPKIVKVFKDYYVAIDENTDSTLAGLTSYSTGGPGNATAGAGNTYHLTQPYDIYDVYYAPTDGGTQERADYIDPDNYLVTKLGLNDLYVATENDRKWTVIDNKVILLPEGDVEYYNVILFCRNYFPEFNQDVSEDGYDINIPNDYKDILITMAAIEAMSDRGMANKYQLYTATLNAQLQLIAQSKAMQDVEEKGQK